MCQLLLSGIAGIAICTTPCTQTNWSLSNRILSSYFPFWYNYNTFSNSHFFSGQSRHASSPSIVLYLWLGARRPMAQSYDSVVSPGTTKGDPCVSLGETLPLRTFHAKLNSQSAVSTRHPTMLQHSLEKQVMSSCTYKNQNFFWFTSNVVLKRPVLLKYWLLRPFSMRKPLAKAVPSKDYFMHMKP
jgi:hypothetical protein